MMNTAEMGRKRAGEKPSSFSVTCSLLSQYLKEKGGFGDVGLGLTANPHIENRGKSLTLKTMNLLPGIESSPGEEDAEAKQETVPKKSPARSTEPFSRRTCFDAVNAGEKPDLNREPQTAAAQMTIFYGGKVVVFDNYPVDKARELMAMAARGCSDPAQVFFPVEKPSALLAIPPPRPTCLPPAPHGSAAAPVWSSTPEPETAAAAVAIAGNAAPVGGAAPEAHQKPTQPGTSDLPIARRVSLHRFLEKRKDRINAKAPYQLNAPAGTPASSASPSQTEEGRQ